MQSYKTYETLVAKIFESLGKLDGVNKLKVQNNVLLPGLSKKTDGTPVMHQIDVYATFEVLEIEFQVVVQAKNWKNPVDMPTVMAFKGVLSDLNGAPRGVIVTRTGFDTGNIQGIADTYKIGLYLLDEIGQGDFAPSVKITGEITSTGVAINEYIFGPTSDNLQSVKALLESPKNEDQIYLFDEQGKTKGTLGGAFNYLAKISQESGKKEGDNVALTFTNPIYLHLDGEPGDKIRIIGFTGKFTKFVVASGSTETVLTYDLRILTGDKSFFVDENGKVHKDVISQDLQLTGELDGQTIASCFTLNVPIEFLRKHYSEKTL